MKSFKASIVATLVAICFAFAAFPTQPAEAMSHHAKSGITASAKHKKNVKKPKKAKKSKKTKKSKSSKKAKAKTKTKRHFMADDPAAQ